MLIDVSKIKSLLNSEVTDYELGKHTGLSSVTFLRYRQGGKVENMSIRVASKLMEYIRIKEEENTQGVTKLDLMKQAHPLDSKQWQIMGIIPYEPCKLRVETIKLIETLESMKLEYMNDLCDVLENQGNKYHTIEIVKDEWGEPRFSLKVLDI